MPFISAWHLLKLERTHCRIIAQDIKKDEWQTLRDQQRLQKLIHCLRQKSFHAPQPLAPICLTRSEWGRMKCKCVCVCSSPMIWSAGLQTLPRGRERAISAALGDSLLFWPLSSTYWPPPKKYIHICHLLGPNQLVFNGVKGLTFLK